MGLLDDAIREHLELKRRRGADPGEVAREEHDALSPVPREAELDPDLEYDAGEAVEAGDMAADVPPHTQGEAKVGQETVEIDMHSELHDGPSAPVSTRASAEDVPASTEGRSAPVGHPAHTKLPDEESLEWEVPTESAGDPVDEAAAATDVGIGSDLAGPDAHEHQEDVLEETPDFLRDTPEQERLWFEQRPPRDFDFNE